MKIKNLCKTYDTKTGEKVHALNGVSFDLPSTGMVAILGKSGSGKSTLLNILSGLDRFDSGDIECFGKNMKDFSHKELDHYRNSCVGFVFQEYHLIPELDVGDNIALALQLQGQAGAEEKVQSVLKQVDLVGYENRKTGELSGGQKQRVAIARALVKDPKIIFADEPTGALDSHTGESILQILKEVAQEKLVVLVTHDREYAEKYGDRVIELADGMVIRDSEGSYRNTDTEDKTELRKSRLPIKTALKIGCSNLRHHRLRLFSIILLSVIAFSLLGISLTVAFLNPTNVFCREIIRNDMEFTAIYKLHWYQPENVIDQSLDQFLGADPSREEEVSLSMEDIEFLKSQFGGSYTLVYTALIHSFQSSFAATLDQLEDAFENGEKQYAVDADGYIAITEEECERLGYTVIGELPKNSSEVAINECIFNTFTIGGLIEDNQTFEIASYEDIIGHKISVIHNIIGVDYFKTITGVVVTGCDRQCFSTHKNPPDKRNGNWETYHDKIFVCQDYFDEYTYALCPIPQDKTELKKMVSFVLEYEENDLSFRLVNKLSDGFYYGYENASLFKMLFFYLSIILLFFAMLLLSNCILTSMRRQMKQIGILSALGTGFKDLFKVYGSAIFAMCSVIAAITLVVQIFGVGWFNAFMKSYDPDLQFDLVPFSLPATLILVLIMAVVAAAGCLIPLIRLRKMDPTTIINKGQIK